MFRTELMKPDNLLVIPEQVVKDCAMRLTDEFPNEKNNFQLCLDYANQFRDVGLTPIYLCETNMRDIYVTTVEKYQNKFH